jgi:hypothetical protein
MLKIDEQAGADLLLGQVAGLRITAGRSAVVASAVLSLLAGLLGRRQLRTNVAAAAAGGLVVVLVHWLSDLAHQLGHAQAAKKAGYPMTGLRLWGLFSTGQYPPDEPELPARIHVWRALGGPAASITLGLVAAPIALAARRGSLLQALGLFAFVDNLFVLGLGAFVPLGFTDGSTLLRWAPKLHEEKLEECAVLRRSSKTN